MEKLQRLTIWTIILNCFIIVGAGHGIGCIGLLEIIGLFNKFDIGTEDFSLSFSASYDKSLSAISLFALIGHIALLISVLASKVKICIWTKIIGLLFLWVSFFYLIHNAFSDNASLIGFISGIPFISISIILAIKVLKQKFHSGLKSQSSSF